MQIEEISHKWPPNIQGYEQKFLGISMTKFIGAGMGGLVTLVAVSQIFVGMGGIIGGAVAGVAVFGMIVLMGTRFAGLNNMTLPAYWLARSFQPAQEQQIELPLILSSRKNNQVTVEDWSGETTGAIE